MSSLLWLTRVPVPVTSLWRLAMPPAAYLDNLENVDNPKHDGAEASARFILLNGR